MRKMLPLLSATLVCVAAETSVLAQATTPTSAPSLPIPATKLESFDTNNSMHHHFFVEDQNELLDIPAGDVMVGNAPVPPEGYEIARIDVVVRLRRKQA